MTKPGILALMLFCCGIQAGAANENYYYEDAVYNENIKSVLMFREGFELSDPIWFMGEDISLVMKFDDL